MTDKPQGLVMPKNPARALQELHRKQMDQPPSGTAIDTAGSTAVRDEGNDGILQPVQPSVSTDVQHDGRQPVRERIQTKAVREPTIRITIDVPESLHARLKEYCLTNRVESLRGLTLALYEDFLSSEEA
jgi:hypothetical protein